MPSQAVVLEKFALYMSRMTDRPTFYMETHEGEARTKLFAFAWNYCGLRPGIMAVEMGISRYHWP